MEISLLKRITLLKLIVIGNVHKNLKNSEIFSSIKRHPLSTILQLYKHLEILGLHLNLTFQDSILPATLLYLLTINILSTYLSISFQRSFKGFENVAHLIFPMFAIETTVAILGLGTMACLVNKRSAQCITRVRKVALSLESWQKNEKQRSGNKFYCKVVKARRPLKIRFASSFVAVSTPLVMISFCAKTTVRLILVQS